jgi:hypothetical protein
LAGVFLFPAILVLAGVFLDVWRAVRDKKRSIATAIAITCIVAGVPTMIAAGFLKSQVASFSQQALETAGIVLMFGAGISGAIGLVWDRRMARRQSSPDREDIQ